jgi:hypothetical protein
MIRRIAWLARLSEKDGFDDFLQDTYMRIAEGALQTDPLWEKSEEPEKPEKSATEQIYGCSKCRYSARGCARCRNPDFKGYRGPRPAESGAP